MDRIKIKAGDVIQLSPELGCTERKFVPVLMDGFGLFFPCDNGNHYIDRETKEKIINVFPCQKRCNCHIYSVLLMTAILAAVFIYVHL